MTLIARTVSLSLSVTMVTARSTEGVCAVALPMWVFYIDYVELLSAACYTDRSRQAPENRPMTPRPMGYATLAVLQALADGHRYGFDIVDHTGLATGTVYPALSSLESRGYAESDWEEEEVAHADRRPPRKYYGVTPAGRVALREALSRLGALGLRTSPPKPTPAQ